MDEQGAASIEHILQRSNDIFRCLHSGQAQAWRNVDLTMPQLKALVCVAQDGDATHSQVARGLGVSLSTVTGIVDRLSEQGLVTRMEDPEDRRITRVLPTPRARELVAALLRYRNELLTAMLSTLEPDQLATVGRAFDYLADAAARVEQNRVEQEEAAVS
jgi:DNA-binding MarR family transcriptional regulator